MCSANEELSTSGTEDRLDPSCSILRNIAEFEHSVQVEHTQNKGRILTAKRNVEVGNTVLVECPLLSFNVERDAPAFVKLEQLQRIGELEQSPVYIWAALCSLTAQEAAGALYLPWPTIEKDPQKLALQLFHPDVAEPSADVSRVLSAFWPAGGGPDTIQFEILRQVWLYNSFNSDSDVHEQGQIFLAASMMSHSCAPNACAQVDECGSLILRAIKPIHTKDEIVVSYLKHSELVLPIAIRRERLQVSKKFECHCERCEASFDDARAFTCPRCASISKVVSMTSAALISCDSCGALEPAEADELLNLEASLEQVVTPWKEQSKFANVRFHGSSIFEVYRHARAHGLADAHWIMERLRAAALATEEDTDLRCKLLRQSVLALENSGPWSLILRARLLIALGLELFHQEDPESHHEAMDALEGAAAMLTIILGESHPESRSVTAYLTAAQQKSVAGAPQDAPDSGQSSSSLQRERREERARQSCMKRFKDTDFATDGFHSGWMGQENMTAFMDCLYQLRTRLRPREKVVYAGGVHYPTLLVTNHRHPPVSASGAHWCWLDSRAISPSGLSPSSCCDRKHGPHGLEACWDDHFTYELCCNGDVSLGELPHFFVGPALDINVANAVRQVGTFDLGQSYAMQTLCKRGDIVLDIGANIGGFTVPLAERVGISGEVHAFEPFRKVFQHLNANVALNGLLNVYTHNVALGREDKEVEAYTPDLRSFNFPSAMRVLDQEDQKTAEKINVRYERRKEKLSVRRLDSFEFAGQVKLIKIDVEFMELEVILGGKNTIRRHRPVMWVENEKYFDNPPDRTFVDTMAAELEYQCRPIAKLELLCMPADLSEGGLPAGFQRVFRHLIGEHQDLSLWKALHEVDPGFTGESAVDSG